MRKFGGNAQAITRQRWLHHTSFLWDFKPENMQLLKAPVRAPDYREVCVLLMLVVQAQMQLLPVLKIIPIMAKTLAYRTNGARHSEVQGRSHLDFICRLKDYLPDRNNLPQYVEKALSAAGFQVKVSMTLAV